MEDPSTKSRKGGYFGLPTVDEEDEEGDADPESGEVIPVNGMSEVLLPEEYHKESQECLVVVTVDETKAAAVCCFRNDKDVEFFVEAIPSCCAEASKEKAKY